MRQLRASQVRHRAEERSDPGPPRVAGRSPILIGDHNLRVILEAIRRDGPLTRLELGRRSGLTGPGITNVLRRLQDNGLVAPGRRQEGGGQPSTEFAINPDGAYGIGIRLVGVQAEAVLLDLAGRVRDSRIIAIGADLPATIATAVRQLIACVGAADRLLGVGIAAEDPAQISLPDLQQALGPLKLSVERDCVAALVAERTFGVGAVEGGVMLVIVDDRIRAGFLFRGVPFNGVHGRAGRIGAMRTGADHVPLDSVAGLAELRKLMGPDDLARLAGAENMPLTPAVRAWVRVAAGHLLDAVVATAGFLAPGAVLIGGDLPRNFIDELIAQMSVERGNSAIRPFITPWISPIRASSFPRAGIALGAAMLPFFELLP